MLSFPRALDIHNFTGSNPDDAGLRTNLSATGYVLTGIKAVIGADGFIHLKTYNNDSAQPVIDYSDVRRPGVRDEFRFYEQQDASKQSDIWIKWQQVSLSANYYLSGYNNNYTDWPENTWVRLLANHSSAATGVAIEVYADSSIGNARFNLQFGLGGSAAEAAVSPTIPYPFRVVGYAG